MSVQEKVNKPHFIQRGTVRSVNDPIHGEFKMPGMPVKTSQYPAESDYTAPTLGEHNAEILSALLGKSPDEISQLVATGILHSGKS